MLGLNLKKGEDPMRSNQFTKFGVAKAAFLVLLVFLTSWSEPSNRTPDPARIVATTRADLILPSSPVDSKDTNQRQAVADVRPDKTGREGANSNLW